MGPPARPRPQGCSWSYVAAMSSTSTLPARGDASSVRRARSLRRVGLGALAVFVAAGGSGLLGTRTAHTTVQGDGYTLTVIYPRVSRPGHAVRLQVEVRKAGGFHGAPVTLRYDTEYFEMFDENAFRPDPESETAGPGFTEDEFQPPDGEVLVMTVDTRVEPARQRGEDGWVSIVGDAGTPVLTAEFSTFLWP